MNKRNILIILLTVLIIATLVILIVSFNNKKENKNKSNNEVTNETIKYQSTIDKLEFSNLVVEYGENSTDISINVKNIGNEAILNNSFWLNLLDKNGEAIAIPSINVLSIEAGEVITINSYLDYKAEEIVNFKITKKNNI